MTARRVFIVDDEPDMRFALRQLLEMQPNLQVVGEAISGEEALDTVPTAQPEIVLMDIRLPGMDGIAATTALKKALPTVKVMILSAYSDHLVEAIAAGADGYLSKGVTGRELILALRSVANDHSLVLLNPPHR